MTELEPYLPHPPETTELLRWVSEFREVATISAQLARTHFVPTSLHVWRKRDGQDWFDADATTAQVASVIMTGQEVGLGPMAALRSVDIIQGTPALRAIALRALLLAHGHEVWIEEATDHRCAIAGRRAGSDNIQRLMWTMDDARKRNLHGKPNWRTQPRNMLIARATADMARLVAADAIMGVGYIAEELEDGVTGSTATGAGTGDSTPAPTRRTRRPAAIRAPMPAEPVTPTDSPPLDEEKPGNEIPADVTSVDDPDPDDQAEQPGMTQPQQRRLHALIRERFGDYRRSEIRETALTHLSETVGRPLDSTADLTFDEASHLIRDLEPDPTDDDEPPLDEA